WVGAFTVLDEYIPRVVPRASVPLSGPQRRDQRAARQPQLDARPPGLAALVGLRCGARPLVAALLGIRQRLGHTRQCIAVPRAQRAFAGPCGPDADPGSLGQA